MAAQQNSLPLCIRIGNRHGSCGVLHLLSAVPQCLAAFLSLLFVMKSQLLCFISVQNRADLPFLESAAFTPIRISATDPWQRIFCSLAACVLQNFIRCRKFVRLSYRLTVHPLQPMKMQDSFLMMWGEKVREGIAALSAAGGFFELPNGNTLKFYFVW